MREEPDHHPPNPRSHLDAVRRWLTSLRQRTQHGAATVGHQARHRASAVRNHADVVRHRVDSFGRRTVLVAIVAAALVAAGVTTSFALVNDREGAEHARRVAGPASDAALLDRDGDRTDRLRRTLPPSDEPSPGPAEPSRLPEEPATPRSTEPSPSPSAKPKQSEQPTAEPKTEQPKAEQPKTKETKAPDWVHPMPGAVTTSCYGPRWGTMHQGVDLALPAGTPIRAVGAGTVIYAGWVFSGYGISVVIDHHNGYLTHYAHASEAKVSVGQNVTPGQTIALEGSTGDSTGPHLHFEVHRGMWNQIEPTSWLRERGVTIHGC